MPRGRLGESLAEIQRVSKLDKIFEQAGAVGRYSVGANLACVDWPGALEVLDSFLSLLDLSGLVTLRDEPASHLGSRRGESFSRRLKQALDPQGFWVEV